MEIHRFPRVHAGITIIRTSLSVVVLTLLAGQANAGPLTTFEDYAAMTPEQQSSVWVKAAGVVFKDALTRHDEVQVQCLRENFSTAYGQEHEVEMAHARLRGWLEAGIEHHDDSSRVEYAVAYHLDEVCPPSTLSTAH